MAISYVQKNGTSGKITSLTSVTLGSLIVCGLQWQDSTNTPTLSDGTNSPDGYSSVVNNGGSSLVRFAYWLSSPKSGSVTYTWTATGGGGHSAIVFEMSTVNTFALDHINAGATGSGTTATTGNETSSETSMVAFGTAEWYSYVIGTPTCTIDGVSADQYIKVSDSGYGAISVSCMRVMNNPGTYSCSMQDGSNTAWACDLIAFKEVVSGSSGNPWYYYAQQMRQKLEEKLKRRIVIPGFADCMQYGCTK